MLLHYACAGLVATAMFLAMACVAVLVALLEPVHVLVALRDTDWLLVAVALRERVPVALTDTELVTLRVAGALGDGVPVRLPVGDALLEPVADALTEPLPVGLPVELLVTLTLPVADTLGVPDGLRSDAMARPRYVSRVTASSPPPAASHSSTDSRSPLAMMLAGTSWLTLAYRKQFATATPVANV